MYTQHDVLMHKLSTKDREIMDLKALVTQLDLTRERLSTKVLSLKRTVSQKNKLLQNEMFERDEVTKKYHAELLRNEKLQKINQSYRSEHDRSRVMLSERDSQGRDLHNRLAVSQEQKKKLEEALVRARSNFTEQLSQKIEAVRYLTSENERLDAHAKNLQNALSDLERQHDEVMNQRSALNEKIRNQGEENEQKTKIIRRLEKEQGKLKEENQIFLGQIEDLTSDREQLTNDLQHHKDLLAANQQKTQELRESYVRQLKQLEESYREKLQELRNAREVEHNDFVQKIGELEAQIAELNKKNRSRKNKLVALKQSHDDLLENSERLKRELNRLGMENDDFEGQLKDTKKENTVLKREVSVLEDKMGELRDDREKVEMTLNDEKGRRLNLEKALNRSKLGEEEMKIRQSKIFEEMNRMNDLLQEKKERERHLETEIREEAKENQTLRSKLHKYKDLFVRHEQMKQELSRYTNNLSNLEDKYASEKRSNSVLVGKSETLEGEIQKLYRMLKEKETQLSICKQNEKKLRERDNTITLQLRNVREELHSIKERTQEVRGDNTRLRDLVTKLDDDREKLMKSEVQLRKEYDSLKVKLDDSLNKNRSGSSDDSFSD